MSNNQFPLKKNKLVLAMSLALLGSAMTGCSSDDDNDNDTDSTASVTINANGGLGGNANFAQGGDGGELYIYNGGTAGGVEIRKTGKADTNFTSPDIPTTSNLGSSPLTISSDITIDVPVLYTAIADAAGTLITDDLYVGTDGILRTSVAGGTADYTNDTIVTDSSYYRSSTQPNNLLQAIGDDTTADNAPSGLAYFRSGDSNIYLAGGDGAEGQDLLATGLSIAAGATLSITDNSGCNANMQVSGDIVNNGTIKPVNQDCTLDIEANSGSYSGSGTITTAGTSSDIDGGRIDLYANVGILNDGVFTSSGYTSSDGDGGDGSEIYLRANGYIVNNGELLAEGGDGLNDGGNASTIDTAQIPTYSENNGTISVDGGDSTGTGVDQGSGGNAGTIDFLGDVATFVKSGSVNTANGGNGTFGGNGGNIDFETNYDDGPLIIAADITANGGEGSTSYGGSGGSIQIMSDGGELLSSSNLSAKGGDSLSTDNNGGSGGYIEFNNYYDDNDIGAGDITVSGNLDVSGGNANATGDGYGGSGGDVQFYNNADNDNSVTDQTISLLGYSSIETNGGDGAEGGDAYNSCCSGNVYIYASSNQDNNNYYHAGSIVNDVPVSAKGGDTVTTGTSYGTGGDGGEVYIDTDTFTGTGSEVTVTNTASIDVSGGMGYDGTNQGVGGGWGGNVYLYALHDLSNSGSINANAGEGGTDGAGGGYIYMESYELKASNTASLSANGSDSTADGGQGGDVEIYGVEISNTGALSVNGGDASDATSSFGGDGGYIGLFTDSQVFGLTNSGSFSFSAGTGETDGTEGCAQTNFVDQGECNF